MKRRIFVVTVIVVIFAVLEPTRAAAQTTPAIEVAGGYGVLRDAELEETFLLGWFASGGWNVTDWLAIVGEVGGQHTRSDFEFSGTVIGERQLDVYTLLAGPRYLRRFPRVIPFLHFLVGAARVKSDFEANDRFFGLVQLDPFLADSLLRELLITQTKPALQVGGGVSFPVGARLSVRLATDYRRVFDAFGRDLNQFRLSSGVVVGFGQR